MIRQFKKLTLAMIAGFSLLSAATIASADGEQKIRKKTVKKSVKKTTTKKKRVTVIVVPEVRRSAIGGVPVRGYWQPGGYRGRIGSPYYYSVRHWVPGSRTVRKHQEHVRGGVDHKDGACGCGRRSWTQHRHADAHRGWGGGGRFLSAHHHGWSGHAGWRTLDPYSYHFGPGFYRRYEHGHYRFPYYSYRSPWYFPGPPVFNRDTNFAW